VLAFAARACDEARLEIEARTYALAPRGRLEADLPPGDRP
jgi:hypothetical protein